MSFDYRSRMRPKETLTVFNPSKEKIERDFGGETYIFPAEGTREISGVTHQRHNRNGELEPYFLSASVVVSHFLGDDWISGHMGPLGCRVLSGDPETDEQIKAEAYKVCKERQYINDVNARSAHLASIKVAKDAGQPPPMATKQILDAYDRIAQYESATGAKAPFKCEACAMPFFTTEAKELHDQAHHAGESAAKPASSSAEVDALKATVAAQSAQIAALADLVKTVTQAKKPGRPRKAVEV